ncbi:MAG: DEAD/DEAH box helicase [Kiritimatiellae bacterium]|nr:DEAD/DEAH box helicase [Kiritimatiellia bacterium]
MVRRILHRVVSRLAGIGRRPAARDNEAPGKPLPPPEPPQRPSTGTSGRKRRRRRRAPGSTADRPPAPRGVLPAQADVPPVEADVPPAPAAVPTALPDVPPAEGKTRFQDLHLPKPILHAVADLGFTYCTPIQAMALPPCLKGRNVAGRAQTGTGKTAAFLICILDHLLRQPEQGKRRNGTPRALVIAPTRELVMQITKDALALARHGPVRTLAVYGGMDYQKQEDQLRREPFDILVATPGRLLDFERRRCVSLRHVEVLVIDEADRMLDMGFIPDVRRIIHAMPSRGHRRTLLFSATLTPEVMRLAGQWMTDPVVVEVEPEKVAVDTVQQVVYIVTVREKLTLLCNILKQETVGRVLVFTNRRERTRHVAAGLEQHGIHCAALSGEVAQEKRVKILDAFHEGKLRVLVATDVAGRGLHVEGITHVINYDFPVQAVDYVHRIGRTARGGATGTAISFACEQESFVIPEIEKLLGESLPCRYPDDRLLAHVPTEGPARRRRGGRGRRRSAGHPRR